jgi:hypothetical protein
MNLSKDRIEWGGILSKTKSLLIPQKAGNRIHKQDSAAQNNLVNLSAYWV